MVLNSLSSFDVSDYASGARQQRLVQCLFGVGCTLAMIVLRSVLDMMAPTSGPFALVYPTVLIATLFGRILAGAIAYCLCFAWAWWFVLAPVNSFAFDDPSDPGRVVINALAAVVIVFLAETFRKAVRRENEAKDDEIARRIVLMDELDHRTKNNFTMVSSLLAIQKRDLTSQEAIDALEQASARVHTFSKAYENLSETSGEGYPVEMRAFLHDVVERIRHGGFEERITFSVTSTKSILPRQTAVVIGIFVNEAVTNCAKYAFPGDRSGTIDIAFTADDTGWHLTIADDGVGANTETMAGNSRGAVLMQALAKQLGASHEIIPYDGGVRVEVHYPVSEPDG